MSEAKGELQRRIEAAKMALAQYPAWVRVNNKFVGGGVQRNESGR